MFFNILLPMRRCLLNIHSVSSGQIENSFVFTKNEKVLLTQISHSTSGPCWPYYCGAMVPLDISWQRFQYSRVWENAKEFKKKWWPIIYWRMRINILQIFQEFLESLLMQAFCICQPNQTYVHKTCTVQHLRRCRVIAVFPGTPIQTTVSNKILICCFHARCEWSHYDIS